MRGLLESIVRRTTRQVIREMAEPDMDMDYRKDFIDWVFQRSDTHRLNAVQLMYEYCTEDDDDALYRLYEEYGDDIGVDLTDDSEKSNWICEEIRRAINEFAYYNFNEEEE